jgi:hypothetical protein
VSKRRARVVPTMRYEIASWNCRGSTIAKTPGSMRYTVYQSLPTSTVSSAALAGRGRASHQAVASVSA